MSDRHHSTDAHRAAEAAARNAYGRLLAYLARAWRDLAAAEDALADALAKALEAWPRSGVPENPDAWLLTAARNRLKDAARGRAVRQDAVAGLAPLVNDRFEAPSMIPDKRLELMFVCAHPAIDPDIHTPLMLQTILGLSAAQIASSYLVSPDAMGRRLGRAKIRIRDIGIAFSLPERDDLPGRTSAVLEAIYAAFGQGWDSLGSDDAARRGLAGEAIFLARLLVSLSPADAEARGLLALMLYCEARTAARIVGGRYLPLAEQNLGLWNRDLLAEAENALHHAGTLANPGRFQLEAAIQSARVQSRLLGSDLRQPLLALHAALLHYAPTLGNQIGWCAALAEANGPRPALYALDALPLDKLVRYQPYWALKAHLLQSLGQDATGAYTQAIGLAESVSVRDYLDTLRGGTSTA